MAAEIENRGPELTAVLVFFLAVANIAILLRCFVRIGMVKAFGLDDYLMTGAAASFILFCTFALVGIHYGTGRHYYDLEGEDIKKATMYWWLCYIFYSLTMVMSKLSIGWFLLRITVRRLHIWIIYASLALTVVTGLVFLFLTVFQCNPTSYFWDRSQDGTCIDIEVIIAMVGVYSAFNIIADFTLAIIPGFIIWKLNMNMRTKLVLVPLMAMGCIASSAVVVRAGYLAKFRDPDFLWATLDIAIWSTVEQGLAITAASLATLRPLMRLLGYKLGISSKPSVVRATEENLGMGAASRGLPGSRNIFSKGSRSDPEAFGLSINVHREISWEQHDRASEQDLEYPASAVTNKSGGLVTVSRMTGENESEEELFVQSPSGAHKEASEELKNKSRRS